MKGFRMKILLIIMLLSMACATPDPYTKEEYNIGPGLTVKTVMPVIRENRGQIIRCLENATPPHGSGRLVVDIKIEADGEVTSVELRRNDLKNPKLDACIIERIYNTWTFPAPGVPSFVVYPFSLNSRL